MSVILYNAFSDGVLGQAFGEIVVDEQNELIELDVSAAILADISSYIGDFPSDYVLVCIWQLSLKVIEFDASKSDTFGGVPPQYKLGTVSFSDVATYQTSLFWSQLNQKFPYNYYRLIPAVVSPINFDPSLVPTVRQFDNIYGSSGVLSKIAYFLPPYNGFFSRVTIYPRLGQTFAYNITYMAQAIKGEDFASDLAIVTL